MSPQTSPASTPISSRLRPFLGRAGRLFHSLLFSRLEPAQPLPVGQHLRPPLALPAPHRVQRPARRRSTILAIGAHPDDVEIGCGGTLASHSACGDDIVILTLSGGEAAGEPAVRYAESQAAANRLGAQLVVESLDDTRISEGPATIGAIEAVIARYAPSAVYVHTEADRHQDHRNVHRAAMVAARNVPSVFCYQSPSTTTTFCPTRFVPISEQLDTKLALLSLYDSQNDKSYLAPDLISATAMYWSRFARARHVEPFEVVREQAEIR
ncbi:MAG: PIG-L family deacetylase [Nannocystaceae bacterium]|nr:PIG-L family deacetylase [Nannocystaceae bacterium]